MTILTNSQLPSQSSKKKLPIGIQTFSTIRGYDADSNTCNYDEFYYVDKTCHILQMVEYHYIFLSRPRRFGKSLTLDTVAELFAGNKDLFKGLYAEDNWDWSKSHPVIRLGFAEGVLHDAQSLKLNIQSQIQKIATQYDITINNPDFISGSFQQLITDTHKKHGQKVVILIDEYDKPILDNLTNPDTALQMRDGLRDLYSVIKGQDAHIRFAMLTGVSKFSKVNLFSGLNNLNDITLDAKFSSLCGYTQAELEHEFAPELREFDPQKVKQWYNGYNWTGDSVYNPFDVLFLFDKKNFQPYWFETGTPTFLIDKIMADGVASYRLDGELADTALLSAFDVGDISPIALMFQTGYLTIKDISYEMVMPKYRLGFPNLEVQFSLTNALLKRYYPTGDIPQQLSSQLYQLLLANDFDAIYDLINAFFASIPHDWHRKNNIAHFEGYWASVFYAYFASLGLDIKVEDSTSRGRMDMTVRFNECIYIFEFKVIEQAHKKPNLRREPNLNTALEQIKDKGYADKYKADNQPIYLIGVEFSEAERNVVEFEVEIYEQK